MHRQRYNLPRFPQLLLHRPDPPHDPRSLLPPLQVDPRSPAPRPDLPPIRSQPYPSPLDLQASPQKHLDPVFPQYPPSPLKLPEPALPLHSQRSRQRSLQLSPRLSQPLASPHRPRRHAIHQPRNSPDCEEPSPNPPQAKPRQALLLRLRFLLNCLFPRG